MNYQLEMNYLVSKIRHVFCLNLSIGANNCEDFIWIVNHINEFRTQSIEIYKKLLCAFLLEANKKLYVIKMAATKKGYTINQVDVHNISISFLDEYNGCIAFFADHEVDKIQLPANEKDIFNMIYDKFVLFELQDYFTEGNSLTFYAKEKNMLLQLEKIAKSEKFELLN